ncbi:MAG: 1-hydroxycarotenoid 3,4-desaturase CrtD [Pseudomonadota bacterium]
MSRSNADGAIVVGAGIGGLAAALSLAHQGLTVDVFERAANPGGKLRTLDSAAGPVDAGPTVFTMRHLFDGLMAEVGERLEDHVDLVEETVLARHFWPDGSRLDLFSDFERSAEAVGEFAGKRSESEFRRFHNQAGRLFEAFDAPVMQSARPDRARIMSRCMTSPRLVSDMAPTRSLWQTLSSAFSDRRLTQLFGRYATYVGGSPLESPAILMLIWRAESAGVWRLQRGMHSLAKALAGLAEARGACFHYNAHVERIDVSRGGVSAVHLADGRSFETKRVVFNGDPAALHNGLLGSQVKAAVDRTAVQPRSLSAFVWSFASKPSGRDLGHHNVFFNEVYESEFRDIASARMPLDPTLYVCAQDRGFGAEPADQERFEIIMNGAPVSGEPQEERPEENEECRKRTFETLARRGLHFDPIPEPRALTTPGGFATLFPGSAGSLYGRSPHGMLAAFQRPGQRTPIPGLYLAGGGVHPGAGVPMAMLSGRHAAAAIMQDLGLTSTSHRTATRGGMSTAYRTTANSVSRSSVS